ncbi:MAG: outer membrane lipoprotein-sorting protein [Lentisphaerae bacterium]|nr:outer membrane lipoprotein-sorting protein [Lentisphaerota bacterium]
MKNSNVPLRLVGVVGLALAVAGAAQQAARAGEPIDATAIMEKSLAAFYAAGADMKAEVAMELIAADGKKRIRVLTMLRLNGVQRATEQKYLLYFHEPSDVRRMTFLVWKFPEKEDDRWIYLPALDLVRRVAASDKRSSFVGSDFTYEDISGRDLAADTHKLLREEKFDGRDCFVIESVPRETLDYARRIAWIYKTNWLPLKEEYYDLHKELARVFTAERIEDVAVGVGGPAIPTVLKRTMRNAKSGHRTEVTVKSVGYNVGLTEDLFTERYLRRPPASAIGGSDSGGK